MKCFLTANQYCPNPDNYPGAYEYSEETKGDPCTFERISLKQLAVWHDELRAARPDDYVSTSSIHVITLRDLAERIFRDIGEAKAKYVYPNPGYPDGFPNYDALYASDVVFCRETLQVIHYDKYSDEPCNGRPCSFVNPDGVRQPLGAPLAFHRNVACTSSPEPTIARVVVDKDRVIANTISTWRETRFLDFCFPSEQFEKLNAVPVFPQATTTTVVPPYYAPTSLNAFIPVLVDASELPAEDVGALGDASLYHVPKQLNDFGDRLSYSEQLPHESSIHQDLVQNVVASTQIVGVDGAYAMTLAGPINEMYYLGRDNGGPSVSFPASVNIEDYSVDLATAKLIISSDEGFSLTYPDWRVEVGAGRYLFVFDYKGEMNIEQSIPLDYSTPLRINPGNSSGTYVGSYAKLLTDGRHAALLQYAPGRTTASINRVTAAGLAATLRYTVPAEADTIIASPLLARTISAITRTRPGSYTVSSLHPGRANPQASFNLEGGGDRLLGIHDVTTNSSSPTYIVTGYASISDDGSRTDLLPSTVYKVVLTPAGYEATPLEVLGDAQLAGLYIDRADYAEIVLSVPPEKTTELANRTIYNESPFRQVVRYTLDLRREAGRSEPELDAVAPLFDLKLYPNPANHELHVSLTKAPDSLDLSNGINVRVYTIHGALVETIRASSDSGLANQVRLDITNLPGGSYFLTADTGAAMLRSEPFVIAR